MSLMANYWTKTLIYLTCLQVTEVRADVKRIEELTKEVRMIHSAILSAPVIDQSELTL